MKKLKFVNKLSYEEINQYLSMIGYELNENLFDAHTGEKISSYDICDNFILCKCSPIKETVESQTKEAIINNSIVKKIQKLIVSNGLINSYTNNSEIIIIKDFYCYTLDDSYYADEKQEFFSETLWKFLTDKFGVKYEVANFKFFKKLQKAEKQQKQEKEIQE